MHDNLGGRRDKLEKTGPWKTLTLTATAHEIDHALVPIFMLKAPASPFQRSDTFRVEPSQISKYSDGARVAHALCLRENEQIAAASLAHGQAVPNDNKAGDLSSMHVCYYVQE
jgi:hypothetical protein